MSTSSMMATVAAATITVLSSTAIPASAQTESFVPVTQAMLAHPDPADWLNISRTYDEHRFSPLNQINKSNVAQLRMAWSRGLPVGTQESTPHRLPRRRCTSSRPAPPSRRWMRPTATCSGNTVATIRRGVQPRAARSKNLGIYEDMIYFAAPDGFLVALDAQTGKLRWETQSRQTARSPAGGLLVADGKVISNRTCEQGKREYCFIAAHDAKTGKEVWKFYVTAAPGEPGGDTWGNMPVEQRAAGPWGLPGSYDPIRKVVTGASPIPNAYTRLKRHGSYDAVSHTSPSELYSNSTRRARRRDRQARVVLPGAAGRRLGCGPQPRTHPRAHARQPRSATS